MEQQQDHHLILFVVASGTMEGNQIAVQNIGALEPDPF